MTLAQILERLIASAHATRGESWDPTEPPLEPHFGTIAWTPPPSYRAVAAAGLRGARREVVATGSKAGFTMLVGEERTSINADLVHMPEGVSREPGVYLSTNHLVGFAEAGHEAVWCFDVSAADADGEYPIYYHHQDEPRARVLATGAWEDADTTPDFVSLAQWLETMTAALLAPALPPWFEHLGRPGLTFTRKRLTLT